VSRYATPAFKRERDRVVLIGRFRPSLAGSEYLEIVHGQVTGVPPEPDLAGEKECADLMRHLVAEGVVDTAHDLSGGGLAVALAEMALAGGIGMEFQEVEIEAMFSRRRQDVVLFGEMGECFLVAVPEEKWEELQRALGGTVPYDDTGRTGGDRLRITGLLDVGLTELREAYERDFFS
jgi:phosphoribosylformylglycinamidine (FGAM) synthase-like enzyme